MKVFQVIIALCLLILLNCDAKAALTCAVTKLPEGLVDTFIKKFKENDDKDIAFNYLKDHKDEITTAIDKCIK